MISSDTDGGFFSPLKLSSGRADHCVALAPAMEELSWRLLEQLSRVCLSDVESATESPSIPAADEQLIGLCERLLIPCQFIELPFKSDMKSTRLVNLFFSLNIQYIFELLHRL